jgi:hypothetical protein
MHFVAASGVGTNFKTKLKIQKSRATIVCIIINQFLNSDKNRAKKLCLPVVERCCKKTFRPIAISNIIALSAIGLI